jgi:hypothetical protein
MGLLEKFIDALKVEPSVEWVDDNKVRFNGAVEDALSEKLVWNEIEESSGSFLIVMDWDKTESIELKITNNGTEPEDAIIHLGEE